MTGLRGLTVLMIAPEPWSHNFLSKHHYALALTQRDNRVFYLNPPGEKSQVVEVVPGIFVVDYKPGLRGINHLPKGLSLRFQRKDAQRLLNMIGRPVDLLWSFDPYRFQELKVFGSKNVWYYAADWHRNKRLDCRTADSADHLFSPAQVILDGIDTRTPKTKINHGVADYFLKPVTPEALPGKQSIKAVYVGNLGSKLLDTDLLIEVVKKNFRTDFIFVGEPEGNVYNELRELGHVYFIGRKSNDRIPGYLAAADLLWLCYDTIRFRREASNSHKVMEYLASGRAVVSTRLEEYADREDLLLMPPNPKDYPAFFGGVVDDLATHNQTINQQYRRNFAAANTYSGHLDQLEKMLSA
ncbi:MAG TPA: glycosyltransferase [Cyclobacteriaceae bacterium]|nr:glycosyltransferase [Cyclobacteriaceae bacterium]